MKLKVIYALVILMTSFCLFSQNSSINPDEYVVKSGDIFSVQFTTSRFTIGATPSAGNSTNLLTLLNGAYSTVTPAGYLSLYPLADTVHVAGKVLRDAYRDIYAKLGETISTDRVLVLLTGVARIRYNVIGAVPNPGEYIRDDIISLFQALNTAGGLMTAASKEVTIRRNEQDHVYDLNRYIMHGDLSQNPLILSEDVIIVKYAENYVKIYIADEIEFIELSEGLYGVRDAISQLSRKNRRLNFQSFTVERDGAFYEVDGYFALRPDDSLYIRTHDVVVYVTGCVVMPGRFVYNGNTSPHYYISQAGGPTPFGSRKRILLLNDEGKYVKYEGQPIKPGDTIYVPESGRSVLAAYIGPIGSVVSILATIFILAQ